MGSETLPIVITVVAGGLSVVLLVAHFTGHTKWARGLDERMWASKLGWLVPGGLAYRVARRWGLPAGPLPFFLGGMTGMWAYEIGSRRHRVIHGLDEFEPVAGGAAPLTSRVPEPEETIVAVVPRHRA